MRVVADHVGDSVAIRVGTQDAEPRWGPVIWLNGKLAKKNICCEEDYDAARKKIR